MVNIPAPKNEGAKAYCERINNKFPLSVFELAERIAQRNNSLLNEDIKSREEKPYEYNKGGEPRRVEPSMFNEAMALIAAERKKMMDSLNLLQPRRDRNYIHSDKEAYNRMLRATCKKMHNLLSTEQGRTHFMSNFNSFTE
ncbi:hypothetical protein L8O47_10750 [Enterobacter roggenkampii]|uniref:hypothetical protein n=1 Tax=Enterobacter roggenkampii TaxID=1812935 RepID=UPI002002AE73|nr:hypothetical protein [Enterobacter roggenkampii]MCK7151386.1 hypothetical protein [Enterobacter roggenkampii]